MKFYLFRDHNIYIYFYINDNINKSTFSRDFSTHPVAIATLQKYALNNNEMMTNLLNRKLFPT